MADAGPRQLSALSAHIEGLEAAVAGLEADPEAGVSVRRIARSLQAAAEGAGEAEMAAGALAIQRATDGQLARSVRNFLARFHELRRASAPDDVHILLVEDNRTVATATAAFLRGPGRTIHVARTAFDAETLLAEHDVDVVILDLILPDRDGRDLLVQMREQAATATLPVIVLSAKAGAVARAECLAVGADVFLEKPAGPKELREAVARLLAEARRRRDAGRDVPTGLPNRVGLTERFAAIGGATLGAGRPLSIAVIRLDALDAIVGLEGREAGDRLVRDVACAVERHLPEGGALGRWEAGTLVAVLPDRTTEGAEAFVTAALASLPRLDGLGPGCAPEGRPACGRGVAAVAEGDDIRDAITAAERTVYGPRPAEHAPREPDADATPRPRRILVVEDDRVTGTLIRHRLLRDGHDVVDFDNGEDAFAWASAERFELAILDVKVPGMDGFEILERLRAIERLASVPIVMLTGMGSEADVIRGLELGADDYMLKPFSPTELLARVRRLLHTRSLVERAPTRAGAD